MVIMQSIWDVSEILKEVRKELIFRLQPFWIQRDRIRYRHLKDERKVT